MLTNFKNGVSSFGMPILGGSIPSTTGNVWFVSSLIGSDGNVGNDPVAPKATVAGAIAAAVANNGDIIILMPGHAETVSTAAYLTINKAGVRIIGLGEGAKRPTFTWNATASQIIVSAANVVIDNVRFDFTGIDAVVAAVSVTGTDFAFINSEVITNSAAAGVVLGFLTAATATRFRFENNFCYGPATNSGTTTTAVIKHEVGTDYIIRGNYFTGKMTQAILNATAVLRGLIDSNRFVIATGTSAITMHASSTPFIVNNRMNVASGTTPVTCAAGFMAGNVYSAAAGVTAGSASTF